jgi:RNase H-like domain found in reverse transcriptase/Reverse transcriptase (RNA-dependent DNA polymerase)
MTKNSATKSTGAAQLRRDTAQAHKLEKERILGLRKLLISELKLKLYSQRRDATHVGKNEHIVAAVRERIERLACKEKLQSLEKDLRAEYKDVFEPIPHISRLSTDVYCNIKLKDPSITVTSRSYSCPRCYRNSWQNLIQQHLDAGRIRPSSSPFALPAFIVPKKDPAALPRWVNDYRQLNANTVTDAYPLPCVDDIIADVAKGRIWSVLDMTNSFFHTRMDPESIPLTAVSTPFGLFEWLVMPMGLRNLPPIHQRRVAQSLREFIGKICQVYMDDIIIWSDSVEEHIIHTRMILDQLRKDGLCLNAKKSQFFVTEVDFLGHHISERGVEAQNVNVERILNWPHPKSAKDVRSYLGIVRYLANFLLALAEHTSVLTPLTSPECNKNFPEWLDKHQAAFDAIKSLVVSRECLTTINHDAPGDNKIFVTTDASDVRTGGVLSWGKTWESARPVAYDSMQLNQAQKNYPVHEKELLAVIRALRKWRADLLGSNVYVYTDHKTLENFDCQKELSRRQARWQEYMLQFDVTFVYVKGEDNTVADALSRLPPDDTVVFAEDGEEDVPKWQAWSQSVNAVLSISADKEFLDDIRKGYELDTFL